LVGAEVQKTNTRDFPRWLCLGGGGHPQGAKGKDGEEEGGLNLQVSDAPKTRTTPLTMAMVTEAVL
jgi:hypothetical protein